MKPLFNSSHETRFNLQSWLTLALAVGFIVVSILYLFLAFKQPADGWLYESRLDGQLVTIGSLLENPGPLQPGDHILAIENRPADLPLSQPVPPPPGWQIGGFARYTIQRGDQQLTLSVPLKNRPFRVIVRFFELNNSFPLTNLLWFLIGFGVFFIRPRETAARLLLLFITYWMTMDTIVSIDTSPAPYYYPAGLFWMSTILNSLWLFMFALIIHFVLEFPLRKWPLTHYPRLSLGLLYGIPAAATLLTLGANQLAIYNLVLLAMVSLVIISLIATTIHSLRHIHNHVVRAQIGWVVLGISAPIIVALIGFIIPSIFPDLENTILDRAWSLISILLPLCFGIAITRYRLFDINIIIRRTLVYSMLSISLALVYFGVVLIFQNLSGALTGERQSNMVIVVSTLLIAALFNPFRRSIQSFIDRRFYRRKYNAEQALQTFAATLRDDVELDQLKNHLIMVVQETVQPESLSLWLKINRP